ncbi:hypothetical protein SRB5_15010 [Streptomyces sp. RB5]|uniref:Uncharacterized protein n=1 Tax=Streptomyces smaragdinus TaxID=2585196 RepID=A0A7K0CD47_9ACTN|nr:hypothetical protein [Streptomyces smaragdinus]MQY11385.1 hypothetical protein [Streptomyces smaragdinus]
MAQTAVVFLFQPVVEVQPWDDFTLWPVAEAAPWSFLALDGALSDAEIGSVVHSVVSYNDRSGGEETPGGDPVGVFLREVTGAEMVVVPGGLRVTDLESRVALRPGCCCGLEGWREWYDVLDGGHPLWLGHGPSAQAERVGDTVRLTLDTELAGSPVIELPAGRLPGLLAGAERDLTGFLRAASDWAARRVPDHAPALTAALAGALSVPAAA